MQISVVEISVADVGRESHDEETGWPKSWWFLVNLGDMGFHTA